MQTSAVGSSHASPRPWQPCTPTLPRLYFAGTADRHLHHGPGHGRGGAGLARRRADAARTRGRQAGRPARLGPRAVACRGGAGALARAAAGLSAREPAAGLPFRGPGPQRAGRVAQPVPRRRHRGARAAGAATGPRAADWPAAGANQPPLVPRAQPARRHRWGAPFRRRVGAVMQPWQRGFTLVEVLVALAIVAIALMAGLQATTALTRNALRQADIMLAQLCAENELVKARLSSQMPSVGDSSLVCEQAGRQLQVLLI